MRLYNVLFLVIIFQSAFLHAQEIEKTTKFVGEIIETEPEYIGGLEEFYKYVYASLPKSTSIKGKFFVSFYVEADGSISEVKVLKGISANNDQKMKIVLEKMPNWTPAALRNEPIRKKKVLQISY